MLNAKTFIQWVPPNFYWHSNSDDPSYVYLCNIRSLITMVIVPIMISLSIIAGFLDDHSLHPDRDHEDSSTVQRSRQEDSVDGDERMGTYSVLHPFVTDESILSAKVNLVSPENVIRLPKVSIGEEGCSPGKASLS